MCARARACVCVYVSSSQKCFMGLFNENFQQRKVFDKKRKKKSKKKKRNSLITCFLCFFFQTVFIQSKEYCYY